MGHVHPHAHSGRRRTALLAAASLACAATVLLPTLTKAHADTTPALTVDYKTTTTSASAGEIDPWMEVVNTGTGPVALSTVTLRYYFTADTTGPYTFQCAWAVPGCANLTGTVVAMATPTATADHYLQISFTSGAGTLQPGASTGDLQLRLYRADWQNVNQANDYSFNLNDTAYTPWNQVTAYVGGSLVWGVEPGGGSSASASASASSSASASASPSSSATGTTPPGATMFDDFSYTGPNDPNLAAHDWKVRTGAGGPGVQNSWSASGISFPADPSAQGGHVMDLTATTDGTTAGTTQAEIDTVQQKFFEGTYAARVYFNDAPTSGANGDHVNETFYAITPDNSLYSEDDFEYLPNGGWGGPANSMYTTTWYSADAMDRVTTDTQGSLQGWHTLVATVHGGSVTYFIDGKQVFSSTGKYYPREAMTIDFNEWFIDLPFTGARSWDQKVNWVYFAQGVARSPADVQSAVNGYYAAGTHFTDSVQ
ncbi:cellulose binding domain-containing protein [Streptacidiphilus jiangxiensis]|uniref:Cellulose binding domain-containing protein n=1 Tax=Streptacidiphilus jiangxiensis TaxID=235985 RepID=A0A1H7U830_STRJI|nr:cellulose binding domain-containing protein [Streptacidiphilus jiangxiensis]SEL93161.1 Cellulose binding domain-containing protein [Streptacidiphilus jiangxiensis]